MPRLLLAALVAFLALFPVAAHAARPEIAVTATDPTGGGNLGRYSALYVRFHYRSDVPLRAQASGYRAGRPVPGAMNPAPPYPAGEGEGIVWISFDTPERIDEVRIEVSGAGWEPLVTYRLPTAAAWSGASEEPRARPEWVSRLSDAQQRATTASLKELGESGGWFGDTIVSAVFLSVPAYFVLQILLGLAWSGRWRLAALAPVLLMLPAIGHAALALAAGSNIWPIVVIFTAPLAVLYLAALLLARGVAAAVT
jgi:hypothetical protein